MTTPTGAYQTAAERQFLVSVTGIAGFWATYTPSDVSAATTDVYNGGQRDPEKIASPPKSSNVKVSRPYSPGRDQPLITRLTPLVGRLRTTVSAQPTDPDLFPVGNPDVYANALLVNVKRPAVDASSGKEAMIELEFAVINVR